MSAQSSDVPAPLPRAAAQPVAFDPARAFVVPASIGELAGKGRARDAVRARWLRPADLQRAKIAEPELVWLPLYRVEGTVDGFHLGLRGHASPRGPRVLPTGGFTHHDGTVLVPARRGLTVDPSGAAKIARGDLRPYEGAPPPDDARIVPDVAPAAAEEEAQLRLRRRGEPAAALYANVEVKIRAVDLVFLPLWVVRYHYAGEASEGAESEYHAAVSAHSGDVVSQRHPPLLGSVMSRVKQWLGGSEDQGSRAKPSSS
jgi:hypothetical protein